MLATLAVVLLGLGAAACGGADRGSGSGQVGRYRNDGDAEQIDDHDTDNQTANHEDGDGDSNEEYEQAHGNEAYRDGDDGQFLAWGHAASPGTVAALVKRYYRAAVAGDGATACALLDAPLAAAVPEDAGGATSPAYLRGKTCAVVMSKLFEHAHGQLSAAVDVTGVRVSGDAARVLLGSAATPASYLALRRVQRAWKIDDLLGARLP